MMNSSRFLLCSVFWLSVMCCGAHKLGKRYLIYPRQAPTRYQFIGGIGIPADLDYESLTVGHVLKAEFFLPYNSSVYRENPYLPEYQTGDNIPEPGSHRPGSYGQGSYPHGTLDVAKRSAFRWSTYAYVVDRLNTYGYNGEECLLRAICEARFLRFERNFNVFAELMHILLSPSTSLDADSPESINFFAAEKLGRKGQEACLVFACQLSLLNFVSNVLHVNI